MTKSYQLYQLIGTINFAYSGTSRKGHAFYYLEVNSESLFSNSKEIIYAFANLVAKEVWNTLEQKNYQGQKYTFYCEKRVRGWRLIRWEEIS